MSTVHCSSAAAVFNGSVHVFGGFDSDDQALNSNLQFRPAQ